MFLLGKKIRGSLDDPPPNKFDALLTRTMTLNGE